MNFRTLWIFIMRLILAVLLTSCASAQKPICGHPGAPANGDFTPIGATFTLDTVVRYKCESGFVTSGSVQRTCRRDGTWSGEIPVCNKNIALGKVATQSSVYRQQRASLAADGLDATCASTPRTPAERWWQLNLGKSVNVALVSITQMAGTMQDYSVYIVNTQGGDSQIVYSRCGNFSGMLKSKSVEIRCKNGAGLTGEYVFIRDNRQGAFSLSLCEVAVYAAKENLTCGQPERPLNAIVKPVNQTTVRYSCQEGFSLNGSRHLHCVDGVWTSPPPFCSDTYCQAPATVPNSRWSATYAEWFPPPDKSHFPFGTMLTYTCLPNYFLDLNGSVVCTGNGSWVGVQPRCLPTSCDPPPVLLNATLHFPNGTSPNKIGATAEVRCDPGFQIPGSEQSVQVQCFVNGSWTWTDSQICRFVSIDENMQPAIGAILGVITVLVITAAVVLVLVYLRQKGYFKRSNLWPHQNFQNSPRSSGQQLSEVKEESASKPAVFDESFNDQDMLYDDVWPSEEAVGKVDSNDVDMTPDGLYADASSSREDLDKISGGNHKFYIADFSDSLEDDGQRIYDQPNDADDIIEMENVYYTPIETLTQETSTDSIDRSQLPPADGAADNHNRKNSECGLDDDHIYEPLRRPVSPNLVRTRPVYAKVDVMNKKFRRSLEDDEIAVNSVELRQPPEGVTYTTPVFANSESGSRESSSSTTAIQRPLPPIPPGSRCSVMIDNALYAKGV